MVMMPNGVPIENIIRFKIASGSVCGDVFFFFHFLFLALHVRLRQATCITTLVEKGGVMETVLL
jgi:hypothetical protein